MEHLKRLQKGSEVVGGQHAFLAKEHVAPYSPDANPLDFTFWVHVESKVCTVCHLNINALKDTVNQLWATMSEDYSRNGCKAFRGRLEAIIAAKGATSLFGCQWIRQMMSLKFL